YPHEYAKSLLEVPGDELWAVGGDDPRRDAGVFLARPLDDLLDVRLGHRLPQLPVGNEAARAIQEAAQGVERAGDVDGGDSDMPVLVGAQGLDEALALGGGLGRMAVEQASRLENAVDAGGATGGDILVEHHEG